VTSGIRGSFIEDPLERLEMRRSDIRIQVKQPETDIRGGPLSSASKELPGIDLEQLAGFLDRESTSAAVREYRGALRSAGP
jgi:hypothetical protein